MFPYELSQHPDDPRQLQLSCAGLVTRRSAPWSSVSPLLPLREVTQAVHWRPRTRPPLAGMIRHKTQLLRARKVINQKNFMDFLHSNDRGLCSRQKVEIDYHKFDIKFEKSDPYGRECWYSGSCVRVVGDTVMFTGNDGVLRVSMMVEDDRGVFEQVPGKETLFRDKKLGHERILSIHPNNEADGDQNFHVGVRYRHGVKVYKVTGGDTFSSAWRLPSSAGLAAMCWQGEDVVTADSEAGLQLWRARTQTRGAQWRLPGRDTADLQWGWAALSPGHHPRSVLAAERTQLHSLDTRSGASVRLDLGLGAAGTWEHIWAVDSGAGLAGHHYYVATDTRLLLGDVRCTRGPVLTRDTWAGTDTPAAMYARARVGGQDWQVAGTRWGRLRVSALDWGHATCRDWRPECGQVALVCGDAAPRVLGPVTSVPGWRDSVARGRQLQGAWLHPAVEERCGLGLTGCEVTRDSSGNVIILAVNALGDLFGGKLTVNENCDNEYEDDTDEWLEGWGQSVIEKSHLPELKLHQRPYLVSANGKPINQVSTKKERSYKESYRGENVMWWSIPIAIKSKKWKLSRKDLFQNYKKLKKEHRKEGKHHKRRKLNENNDEEKSSESDVDVATEAKFAKFNVKLGTRSRYSGLPPVTLAEWKPEFVEQRDDDKKHLDPAAAARCIQKFLMKMKPGGVLRFEAPVRETENCGSYKLEKDGEGSGLNYAMRKKFDEEDQSGDTDPRHHLLHQFQRLDIADYAEDAETGVKNRHSASVLRILTGAEDHRIGEKTFRGRRPSRAASVDSSVSAASPAAPPREEDTAYTMDSFWADLGVDIPPPGAGGRRSSLDTSQHGKDPDADMDLDLGDEEDFEL